MTGRFVLVTGGSRGVGPPTAVLASDDAAYGTGGVLPVDGGLGTGH